MAQVNTVLGPVSSDELGLTLIHEHLITGFPGWECDALAVPYDREVISRACAQALEEAKIYGVQTMVDATPNDLGRDVELQKMVSERSGINIICATGLYTEVSGKSVYFKARSRNEDTTTEIYETFMKEITQGIGETGIKAGLSRWRRVVDPYPPMRRWYSGRPQGLIGRPVSRLSLTHPPEP